MRRKIAATQRTVCNVENYSGLVLRLSQQPSAQAFLFGLHTHRGGDTPLKLTQGGQTPNAGQAVHEHRSHGPRWGGGTDLSIVNNPHQSNCVSNLGYSYNPPPGGQHGQPGTNDYFAEANSFTLAEWEVFRVVSG